MDMRDEGGVDPLELSCVERHPPPEVPHPRPKDGVGQQADPVQLDQHGPVPDVEKPARDGYAPIRCMSPSILALPRTSDFIPSV